MPIPWARSGAQNWGLDEALTRGTLARRGLRSRAARGARASCCGSHHRGARPPDREVPGGRPRRGVGRPGHARQRSRRRSRRGPGGHRGPVARGGAPGGRPAPGGSGGGARAVDLGRVVGRADGLEDRCCTRPPRRARAAATAPDRTGTAPAVRAGNRDPGRCRSCSVSIRRAERVVVAWIVRAETTRAGNVTSSLDGHVGDGARHLLAAPHHQRVAAGAEGTGTSVSRDAHPDGGPGAGLGPPGKHPADRPTDLRADPQQRVATLRAGLLGGRGPGASRLELEAHQHQRVVYGGNPITVVREHDSVVTARARGEAVDEPRADAPGRLAAVSGTTAPADPCRRVTRGRRRGRGRRADVVLSLTLGAAAGFLLASHRGG